MNHAAEDFQFLLETLECDVKITFDQKIWTVQLGSFVSDGGTLLEALGKANGKRIQ